MNRKLSATTGDRIETEQSTLYFHTETIEVSRLSALAFLKQVSNHLLDNDFLAKS